LDQRSPFNIDTTAHRLKPNSLQSIYVRPEEAAEKLCNQQESNVQGQKCLRENSTRQESVS
jgi:hypothetical protein